MEIKGQRRVTWREKILVRLNQDRQDWRPWIVSRTSHFFQFATFRPAKLKRRWKEILFLLILLVLLWGAFLKLMDRWLLLPRAETFSGLYFVDYHTIPKEIAPGETIYFPFVIQNREASGKNYHYQIILSDAQERRVLQAGTVWVEKGQDLSITGRYAAGLKRRKEMITVELNGGEQKLHFLLNKYLDPTAE